MTTVDVYQLVENLGNPDGLTPDDINQMQRCFNKILIMLDQHLNQHPKNHTTYLLTIEAID